MDKKVLFSPVGGTDPISENNCRDGSLLHICRAYRPDIVYLYMSHEILENHRADDRYVKCLNWLSDECGFEMEIRIIERDELVNVQQYDYFYGEFVEIIQEINRVHPDHELLLNVSSGTPAMKSALMVINALGEYSFRTIQVSTPGKSMNEHTHKGEPVEILWELNEDRAEDYENRCEEISCPSLIKLKYEEHIKQHLLKYDYFAAYDVAETLKPQDTSDYLEMLEMARARYLLDFKNYDIIAGRVDGYTLPVRDSDKRKYFEYALLLDIKIKRGEYADFIRAITPIVVDLFERILKIRFRINIDDYCYTNRENIRLWDRNKLAGSEIEGIFNSEYGDFNYRNIYSDHLRLIIKYYAKNDDGLIKLVDNVRGIENNIRNLAAHEVVSIDPDSIKTRTGFKPDQIMKMIKDLFNYSGMSIKPGYWDSYDEMNRLIITRIEN